MSMLICVDVKAGKILHPEVLKLVDSFEALTEQQMMFVVLFCDYSSPYKQFPDNERQRKAMFHAFDDNVPKLMESHLIKNAIQDYMSLQYNPKIEVARKYQQKIDKFLELMDADDSPSSIKKITEAISGLRANINALNKEVDEETLMDGVIKGKMTLSFLEKIQSNMKHYKAITAKK